MIGLDTNVLVRYIVQDDLDQAAAATRLVENHCHQGAPGLITHVVLAELCWVLQRGYGYAKAPVVGVLDGIFTASELRVQAADIAWTALRQFENGRGDYADYLIAQRAKSEGCTTTWTFDKKAAQSPWHTLLTND